MAKRLYELLKRCPDEEQVKAKFLSFFKAQINTLGRIDHYTESVLHEFKYDKNFQNRRNVASVIAQTIYYAHYLKYSCKKEYIGRPIPPYTCVVDKNEGFFFETKLFQKFYDNKKYDWDRAASTPSEKLVSDIEKSEKLDKIKIYSLSNKEEEELFISHYRKISERQLQLSLFDKKAITEENFWEVFSYWNSLFGEYVKDSHQTAEYFLADIEDGKSLKLSDSAEVMFNLNNRYMKKSLQISEYDHFWENYNRIHSTNMPKVKQKADRLIGINERKFKGDFYTPIEFAEKGLAYLETVVGKEWWKSGKFRFWDMAAGTGNLEFKLPSSALPYCYISTIREDDADYCKRLYPNAAAVFEYDYLNDDIDHLKGVSVQRPKMPENLQKDLADPELTWIIFINPPFATAQNKENVEGKKSKKKVAKTAIRSLMTEDDLGEVSRELFSQFLYRISKQFSGKKSYLCLYSTLKYISANNDQKMRDGFFQYKFEKGFMFNSICFHGTSRTGFPVGFLIWDLNKKVHLQSQNIQLDVFNEQCEKIGTKQIAARSRKLLLNKWVPRPKRGVKNNQGRVMPPFTSAFNLTTNNVDSRGTAADGFICCCVSNGDDFQHRNGVCLLSAPYANAGGFSVVPDNFEKAMTLFAVKKIPGSKWTNNRDMFYAPSKLPNTDFENDCVIYSAFSLLGNQCVALKDVQYNERLWQIPNNMYPFTLDELRTWDCTLQDIRFQFYNTNEDMFLANWLKSKSLSKEAAAVVSAAKDLYKFFYKELCRTAWLQAKIQTWNVGLHQIKIALRNSPQGKELLNKLKIELKNLAAKLLPQVYDYGFILPDVKYFEDV